VKCNFEWLSTYLDGELSDEKRAELEKHLKTCEVCTAKLDELARLEATAKKIPVPQLSEAYWENFASRVQNKIAIRGKQKRAPWLENLKRFFQPSTGKLALAGSLATILLVAIIGQDYWKKETYKPPAFQSSPAEGIVAQNDSLEQSTLSEKKERQVEADKDRLITSGRRDEPVLQKSARENKQKELPVPSASAIASKPTEETVLRSATKDEKTNEFGLAEGRMQTESAAVNAPAAANKPIQGDTVLVTARGKAEIRKQVATSQVKVAAEEIEKLPIRKVDDLLKIQVGAPTKKNALSTPDSQAVSKDGLQGVGLTHIRGGMQSVQGDTVLVTAGRKAQIRKQVTASQVRVAQAEPMTKRPYMGMPPIDTAQAIDNLRQIIAEKEKQLSAAILKSMAESLYTFLGNYYVALYRFSQQPEDWNKADVRLKEFLQKDISDGARQKLLAIQAELKKIKK